MERDELRTTLVNHLETLRRNLQVVSMEVLKTKYKKPFDALRQDICKAATAYTRFLVFDGMRIKHKYFDEAVPYIDTAVKQTKRLKQISDAAFQRQDIDEIESLALALRKEIEAALQPFYMGHMCLYVTPECFDEPPKTPEVYNDATACVWRDGTWVASGRLSAPEVAAVLMHIGCGTMPQFCCIGAGIRLWLPYRCADVCGRLRPTAANTGT